MLPGRAAIAYTRGGMASNCLTSGSWHGFFTSLVYHCFQCRHLAALQIQSLTSIPTEFRPVVVKKSMGNERGVNSITA